MNQIDKTPVSCPVCGSSDSSTVIETADELASQTRTFKLVRCKICDTAHTEPLLTTEQLRPYYYEGYWHQTENTYQELRSFVRKAEQLFINFQLNLVARPLKRHLPKGKKVLDVGTGSAEFMHTLQKAGYDVYGVDPSQGAVEHARKSFGEHVHQGTIEQVAFPEESFDAVTFIHVLEHVQNPDQTIAETARILKPGGFLLIEVPHLDSVGFRLSGKRWLGLDIPRHLYHFSNKALRYILEKHGLEVIEHSYFSFRVSPAYLVVSLFPVFNPLELRRQENNKVILKFSYLAFILLATPIAMLTAAFKRGETLTVLAVKRSP